MNQPENKMGLGIITTEILETPVPQLLYKIPPITNNIRYQMGKSKLTQITMVRDRGYTLPENEKSMLDFGYGPLDVMKYFEAWLPSFATSQPDMTLRSLLGTHDKPYIHVDTGFKLAVIFTERQEKGTAPGLNQIKVITGPLVKSTAFVTKDPNMVTVEIAIKELIVIADKKPSASAMTELNNSPALKSQVFTYAEISYIVNENFLAPKMYILSEEEITELKKEVTIQNLKRMSVDDPMAKYYSLEVGQVVRVTRSHYPTQGQTSYLQKETIDYRTIVNRPLQIDSKSSS